MDEHNTRDEIRTGLRAVEPHYSAREVYAALHVDYSIEPDDPREYRIEDIRDVPPLFRGDKGNPGKEVVA